jgi:hypothetical protein
LSYIAFIMLYYVLFQISTEILLWKDAVFCQRLFLHQLRWSCDYCPCSVYMLSYICQFACTEPSLHSWSETDLIMVYDLFDYVIEFRLTIIYWEFLHLCSKLACNSLYLLILVSRFGFLFNMCMLLFWTCFSWTLHPTCA